MSDEIMFGTGQAVCIAGVGIDSVAHQHGVIEKITKTQIVVKNSKGRIERFRRNGKFAPHSIPQSSYGGTTLHAICQKPKGKR